MPVCGVKPDDDAAAPANGVGVSSTAVPAPCRRMDRSAACSGVMKLGPAEAGSTGGDAATAKGIAAAGSLLAACGLRDSTTRTWLVAVASAVGDARGPFACATAFGTAAMRMVTRSAIAGGCGEGGGASRGGANRSPKRTRRTGAERSESTDHDRVAHAATVGFRSCFRCQSIEAAPLFPQRLFPCRTTASAAVTRAVRPSSGGAAGR